MNGLYPIITSLYKCSYSVHILCPTTAFAIPSLCQTSFEMPISAEVGFARTVVEKALRENEFPNVMSTEEPTSDSDKPPDVAAVRAAMKSQLSELASNSLPDTVKGTTFQSYIIVNWHQSDQSILKSAWSFELRGYLEAEDHTEWQLRTVTWTTETNDDGRLYFKNIQASVPSSDAIKQFFKDLIGLKEMSLAAKVVTEDALLMEVDKVELRPGTHDAHDRSQGPL